MAALDRGRSENKEFSRVVCEETQTVDCNFRTPKFKFQNVFLPSALRTFFAQFHIPKLSQASKLEQSIQIFSRKYESDNPTLSLDSISITAYAIVLLSVDLSADNNQIRNKMSKREVSFGPFWMHMTLLLVH